MAIFIPARSMNKQRLRITSEDEEDRISKLPDDVIHQILKFVDTKSAFRTSVLSKRWKLIWTTLPFLEFKWNFRNTENKSISKFTRHVLKHRNHYSWILHLTLEYLTPALFARFVKYAISHHVRYLNVVLHHNQKPSYKLSGFSSNSIEILELDMNLEDSMSESDCWVLPALTTLILRTDSGVIKDKLTEVYLSCLPALRTLRLFNLNFVSVSLSLPALTTLELFMCVLPKNVWNLPALESLTLNDVIFPENMGDLFNALVGLRNLTLSFCVWPLQASFISCPQLVNLEITTRYNDGDTVNRYTVVSAPNVSNFTSLGIFPIIFTASKLDNVNLKLCHWTAHKNISLEKLKECFHRFAFMLPGLGSAKILDLDLVTVAALSLISDFLVSCPSPFYNLKYVKLPQGCSEASISSNLRSYLLGGSPSATIVTTLPQVSNLYNHFSENISPKFSNNIVQHTSTVSVTGLNVVIDDLGRS